MKTECLRAAGIWVDSDRVSSLKEFGIILYSGEIIGMLGLVGSGITVVADALSGRKNWKKARLYGSYTCTDPRNGSGGKNGYLRNIRKDDFFR